MDRINIFKFYLLSIFGLLISVFLFANSVNAARIFFEPASIKKAVGDDITISVRMDTQGEEINAIDLAIIFPPLLEAKSISKSGSIIQLWVQEPSFNTNSIILMGGSPGGIKTGNGLLAKISFRAKAIGTGGLSISPASSVLLNDGQGTSTSLLADGMGFSIVSRTAPKEETKESDEEKESSDEGEIKDKQKPKRFKLIVGSDSTIFRGKRFVSFFTTDEKSGIDHYEIKIGNGNFKAARTPYLIPEEDYRSVIRVRAYDGTGNYRESVYPNLFLRFWWGILGLFS